MKTASLIIISTILLTAGCAHRTASGVASGTKTQFDPYLQRTNIIAPMLYGMGRGASLQLVGRLGPDGKLAKAWLIVRPSFPFWARSGRDSDGREIEVWNESFNRFEFCLSPEYLRGKANQGLELRALSYDRHIDCAIEPHYLQGFIKAADMRSYVTNQEKKK